MTALVCTFHFAVRCNAAVVVLLFIYDLDFRPFTTMMHSRNISYNSYHAQILVVMGIIVEVEGA